MVFKLKLSLVKLKYFVRYLIINFNIVSFLQGLDQNRNYPHYEYKTFVSLYLNLGALSSIKLLK